MGRSGRPASGEGLGWGLVAAQFALLGVIALEVLRARRVGGVLGLLGITLIAAGTVPLVLASRSLGRRLRAHPAPHEEAVLRTTGVYGLVRHPNYLGLLLLAHGGLGLARTRRSLLALAALSVLLHVKADFEERLLRERFPDYAAYAARVSRIVPGL